MQRIRSFVDEFGWRAYAIPVLTIITVWILVDIITSPDASLQATPAPSSPEASPTAMVGPDPATLSPADLSIFDLPEGGPYAESGDGTYRPIGTPGAAAGEGRENIVRYVIEVENGVDTTGQGGDDAVARMIDSTLLDPRGWTNDPQFRLEHVAPDAERTLTIRLVSSKTVADLCGTTIKLETSCRIEDNVYLNHSRWVRGAVPFEGNIGTYQQYLINHEVGHALGYEQHQPCSVDGELAPIMMQQTISLSNDDLAKISPGDVYSADGKVCRYNGWPYPTATAPAPGVPQSAAEAVSVAPVPETAE
ncbi:DUF3152 domain-containing protein [Corynebacterium uterequi]|uniref:Putative DUF3152 family protein n=1 Tax=Corynebacterium uterequi TaxID=1072256 RepID=A0A0G3HB54_9CORY|nr:DUF3152 domain-containing protein [Corynebacterium uterequi]AKK10544.1 putative DUF3152 family protein [Corynebacterium uterequi]